MKKFIAILISCMLIFAAVGCNNDETKTTDPSKHTEEETTNVSITTKPLVTDEQETSEHETDEPTEKTDTGTSASPKIREYDYDAEYLRVYPSYEDNFSDEIKTYIINSKDELDKYIDENEDIYNINSEIKSLIDDDDFADIYEEYDEEFFEENSLVILFLAENSGSIRHEITEVSLVEEGKWLVEMEKTIPENVTDDIAYWNIFLEIEGKNVVKADDDIEVKVTNIRD